MSIRKAFIFAVALAAGNPAFAQEQASKPSAGAGIIRMYDVDGIRLWAECAWKKLPVSSQSLVDYHSHERQAPENDGIPFASGEEALNYRINAVCGGHLSPSDHNAISPMVKRAKQRILRDARPADVDVEEREVKSYICAMKVGEEYLRTEFELQTPSPRRIPPSQSKCFLIKSDGSLQDA